MSRYPVQVPGQQPDPASVDKILRGLATGTFGQGGEVVDTPYYDTQYIQTAVNSYTYFTAGIGQPFQYATAGNKTNSNTNIRTAPMVSRGQKFICQSISVEAIPVALLTGALLVSWIKFLQNSVLALRIENKDYIYQSTLASIMGINFGCAAEEAVATGVLSTNMQNFVQKEKKLRIPIVIAEQVQFRGELNCDVTPDAGLNASLLKVRLNGIRVRAN